MSQRLKRGNAKINVASNIYKLLYSQCVILVISLTNQIFSICVISTGSGNGVDIV